MPKLKTTLHDLFLIGIIIKGVDGLLELIGGIILLFIKVDFLAKIIEKIFQHELAHDPTDFFANYFMHTSQSITTSMLLFAAIYLIVHGAIKISLFLALWYKKHWAYPVAAVVLSLMIIYQLIRINAHHSIILIFLTLIDMIILVLLRFEYHRVLQSSK
jgi:uncharacterized membrane protein